MGQLPFLVPQPWLHAPLESLLGAQTLSSGL